MKIRLLDYLKKEHFVDIPNDTDEICISVISGDMVMTSPVHYDTTNNRRANFRDAVIIIKKEDFDILNKVKSSFELICWSHGDDVNEEDEIEYNEIGFGFKVDKEFTKWLVEDRHTWGGFQKGVDKKYVVIGVYNQVGERVQNLLIDTDKQELVMELGLGLDQVGCKLDMIRLNNEINGRVEKI